MAECQLPKLNVGGSTPLSRSILQPSETTQNTDCTGFASTFLIFSLACFKLKQAEFLWLETKETTKDFYLPNPTPPAALANCTSGKISER